MVTTKPFKVLVCLVIAGFIASAAPTWAYNGYARNNSTGVQPDVLSSDPGLETVAPAKRSRGAGSKRRNTSRYSSTAPSYGYGRSPAVYSPPLYRNNCSPAYGCPVPGPGYGTGIGALPAAISPLGGMLRPAMGMFNLPGLPFAGLSCSAYLPRPGCKQVSIKAKAWCTELNGSKIIWGPDPVTGGRGYELDLHEDLKLDKQKYNCEYEIRCQIRKNWATRFIFMPLDYNDSGLVETPGGFFFGGAFYPQGSQVQTTWNRNIYRWELVYSFCQAQFGVASLFAGYYLYDDKLKVSRTPNVSRTRSDTFGLATAGGELERLVCKVGCGGTASLHCKWSVQFLEGYFGWDGESVGRISVPMNCGRYGFLEAGWRWIVLEHDKPANADETSMDGLIGSIGLIF
ncbi:hypothetical protein ACFL2Q_09120 [Thermodesulfobacteriota bacterium]